ncbi:MAG: diguanylate cyclase [Myxococcales bacterium]|nr:diguanylate cyclase [Myxococcales bacterium]
MTAPETLAPADGKPSRGEPGPRILVADDSAVVRKVIGKLLRTKGYRVTTVDSGEAAFEQAFEEPFDVIVTDVIMGAVSGIQLCRLLRSDPSTAPIPVVLLTAAYDPRSRFWGAHSGADACIAKESMAQELLPTVERLLTQSRHRTEGASAPTAASRRVKPLELLSQVFDQLLFDAVVGAQARRLLTPGDNRNTFGEKLTTLCAEITDFAYLTLRLQGETPDDNSYHLFARGPWPAETNKVALSSLGLGDVAPKEITVLRAPESTDSGQVPIQSGEMTFFPIEAQERSLGELCVFGGHKRLGAADRATLEVLCKELALIATALLLMERSERLAATDSLTSLPNRGRCNEALQNEVERARRYGVPFCVALIDIDRFKSINDEFGHAAGDDALRDAASILRNQARNTDFVGRWGGEEFIAIMPGTRIGGAKVAADRLRGALEKGAQRPDGQSITISVGVAQFDGAESAEVLIDRVDRALYAAKDQGRNRVVVDDKVPGDSHPSPG